jgi:PKD domain
VLHTPTGPVTTDVSIDALTGNPGACPRYTGTHLVQHSKSGGLEEIQPPFPTAQTGVWPLSSILACLGRPQPFAAVSRVLVHGTNGRAELGKDSQLLQGDIDPRGSTFPDTSQMPIIFVRGTSWVYYRPWRGTSTDFNSPDQVEGDSDSAIVIEVYTGPLLDVHMTADLSQVDEGRVSFTATVSGNSPGSHLTWDWESGDNQSSSAAGEVSFTYAAAGDYTASLQVSTDDGSGGGDQVPITVPARAGEPTPVPTKDASTPGPNDGSNGVTPPGSATPHNRTPGQRNGGDKSRSPASGAKGGRNTPSKHGRPHASATPSPPSASPGSGESAGTGGGSPSNAQNGAGRRKPATRERNRREKTPDSGLERVTGLLVSDVIPLSAAASPLVQETGAPRGSAARARRHVEASPVPAIIGASLAVLLLLGLGAARELDVRWSALLPRLGS